MRAAIIETIHDGRNNRCQTAANQNANGCRKANQYRPLHLIGFDLFAQELRRPADHQSSDKYRQDGKGQHTIKAASHAAKDNLAKLHQEHGHHSAQRRIAVMHGVDRAVGGRSCKRCPGRGSCNTKACLLALHIAACLINHGYIDRTILGKLRRGRLFADGDAAQSQHQA